MQNSKFKIQNDNSKFKIPAEGGFRNFAFCILHFAFEQKRMGVTLLFVVVVVGALLSVSLGIFTVIYGELRLAGEISDSFKALYSADEAMEWVLYTDRNANGGVGTLPGCAGSGNCDYSGEMDTSQNSRAYIELSRRGRNTVVSINGEYPRGGGEFTVRRALRAIYQK